MRVQRMPMHLSSGHLTLCQGNSPPPSLPPLPNFPQSDLGRRANSRWDLPQISSYYFLRSHAAAQNPRMNCDEKAGDRLTVCEEELL